MKLNYDRSQLLRAAKFINKKNKHAIGWGGVDGIARMIHDDMMRLASDIVRGRDAGSVSTGGYWIYISYEGDDELVAEILVDPAVGKDRDFMDVTV